MWLVTMWLVTVWLFILLLFNCVISKKGDCQYIFMVFLDFGFPGFMCVWMVTVWLCLFKWLLFNWVIFKEVWLSLYVYAFPELWLPWLPVAVWLCLFKWLLFNWMISKKCDCVTGHYMFMVSLDSGYPGFLCDCRVCECITVWLVTMWLVTMWLVTMWLVTVWLFKLLLFNWVISKKCDCVWLSVYIYGFPGLWLHWLPLWF